MHYKKTIATVLGSILIAAVLSSQAMAHAAAKKSNPADGAELSESPRELSIQFNGPAKLISVQLKGSDGDSLEIDVSEAKSVDGLVSVEIPPLDPDSYTVMWRVMSVDGHPSAGKFTFKVLAPDGS